MKNLQRAAILAIAAVIVHVAMVAESQRHAPFRVPIVDAASYHWQAVGILQHTTPARAFWQPPLYPYWLALTYASLSPEVEVARYTQGLFFVLTVVLTFAIGVRLASVRTAFWAALVVCGYGPLVFYSGMLLPNAMATALDMVLLLCLLRLAEAPSWGRALACGVAGGAAVLAVPNVALLLPVVVLWLMRRAAVRGRWLEGGLLVVSLGVGFLLCVAPVTLRNRMVSGEWVLVSTHGGINFFIGNNPQADATQAIRPGEEWGALVSLPYREGARSDREAEAFFYREALRYLVQHPGEFLRNIGVKSVRFWNAREIPRNTAEEYFCAQSTVLRPLVWRTAWFAFPFGVLGPLGILGLVMASRGNRARQWVGAFIVVYALSVILFFPAARYRLPIIPPLALFAVLGAEHLLAATRRDWRRGGGLVALLIGMAVVVNWPIPVPTDPLRLDAELHTDVGIGLQTRGQPAEALKQYEAALAVDARSAEALYCRGTALRDLRRTGAAIESFRRCLAIKKNHRKALHDLSLLLFEQRGQEDEACRLLCEVVAQNPSDRQAMKNLGVMLTRMGRKPDAAYWLKKAGAIPETTAPEAIMVDGTGVRVRVKAPPATKRP